MSILVELERFLIPLGTCYRCRRPWKSHARKKIAPNHYRQLSRMRFWGLLGVEPHLTRYKGDASCFPLCEDCWRELGTAEARIPYYRLLAYSWLEFSDRDDVHYDVIPGMILGLIREELA